MAANKRKILEAARKLAQKGAKAKALKEYDKLLKLDPSDAKLRLEIGDAHRRWGQVKEAVLTYRRVADQYMKEGFDARAVAVFKQILNLDAESYDSYEPLAELYQRMGLTSEAIGALQTAADGLHKQGKKREALEILRKMATLDPTNTTSRLKVADLLRQEGMGQDAVVEYEAVIEEFERQGELEGAARACERILEIEPDRAASLMKIADLLLARGQGERAEPFVKRALEKDSDSTDAIQKLADVYQAQGRDTELADTYRRLADVYRRRGDDDKAVEITQRFVPPDTLDAEGVEELGPEPDLFGDEGLGADALNQPILAEDKVVSSQPEVLLEEDDVLDLSEPARSMESEEPAEQPSLEIDVPDEPGDELGDEPPPAVEPPLELPEGEPEQLLAEASVYLRYGKRDQAIANLEAVILREPRHRAALEKLGEAYADGGNGGRAVELWQRAAAEAQSGGDAEGLRVLRGRIGALDPDAAAALDVASVPVPDPVIPEPPPELELSGMDASEAESTAYNFSAEDTGTAGAGPGISEPEIDLDDIEIDIDDSSFDIDDAAAAVSDVSGDVDVSEISADIDSIDIEDDVSGGPGESSPALDAASPDTPDPAGASSSTSQQIVEDLEEADFYMQQGLTHEAEEIYKRILSFAPNHPHALVRLGEIAAERGEDPGSTGSGPVPPAGAAQEVAPDVPDVDLGEVSGSHDPSISDIEIEMDLSEDDDSLAAPGERHAGEEGESADASGVTFDLDDIDIGDELASDITPDEESLSDSKAVDVDADTGVDEPVVDEDTGVDVELDAEDSQPEEETGPEVQEPELSDPVLPDPEPEISVSEDTEPEVAEEEVTPVAAAAAEEEVAPPSQERLPERRGAPAPSPEPGFDLAAELSDVFDDNASSSGNLGDTAEEGFEAVFAEFKKGVSETVDAGDYDTHYDLGIAYREMGLFEDAAGEFRVAMGSAEKRLDCLRLMGLCALELSRPDEAVGHFQEVLAVEDLGEQQQLATRLDLGRALEAQGDVEGARAAYDAVAAIDPSFCDVEELLEALEAREKPDGDALAQDAVEESFESFDDVVAEANDPDEDAAEAAPESFESFDDVISDVEDEDAGDASDDLEDEPDDQDDEEPDSEEPEPDEPEPDPEPEPKAPKKRRRKKISFV